MLTSSCLVGEVDTSIIRFSSALLCEGARGRRLQGETYFGKDSQPRGMCSRDELEQGVVKVQEESLLLDLMHLGRRGYCVVKDAIY